MSKKALLVILCAVFWDVAFCASPPQNQQKDTASNEIRETTDGNVQASGQGQVAHPALQRRNPRYQLCRGDVFDLDFPFTPEFNQQAVTVQPDGYISLRGVGDLHVEGQTVPEATEALRTAYGKILHDPVISIALKDFNKPYFIVTGQVAHPGKFDLRGDTTVIQGLAIAGGITDFAKHSQVLLFRRVSSDWYEARKINVKRLLHGMDLNEDLHLQPDDMLFVPTSTIFKVKRLVPSYGMGVYYNPNR
jgi:polysaccharide export outer membrane protein